MHHWIDFCWLLTYNLHYTTIIHHLSLITQLFVDRQQKYDVLWHHALKTFTALLIIFYANPPFCRGQLCGALVLSFMASWTHCWINNGVASDLRCHDAQVVAWASWHLKSPATPLSIHCNDDCFMSSSRWYFSDLPHFLAGLHLLEGPSSCALLSVCSALGRG